MAHSTAYKSGVTDGEEWCRDQDHDTARHGNGLDYEQGLNKPGQLGADEALINAIGHSKQLAEILGLSVRQMDAQGTKYRKAIDEYNNGWDAAINARIAARDKP